MAKCNYNGTFGASARTEDLLVCGIDAKAAKGCIDDLQAYIGMLESNLERALNSEKVLNGQVAEIMQEKFILALENTRISEQSKEQIGFYKTKQEELRKNLDDAVGKLIKIDKMNIFERVKFAIFGTGKLKKVDL
jgi:hypothetical protein